MGLCNCEYLLCACMLGDGDCSATYLTCSSLRCIRHRCALECVCKFCLWVEIWPRPRVDTSIKCVSQFKLYINVAYVGNCICIPLRRQYVQMEIVFQPRTAAQVCAASIVLCLLVLLPIEIWFILLSGTRYDCCLHPQSRQNQKLLRQPPPRVMPLGVVGAWVGGWAGCWS